MESGFGSADLQFFIYFNERSNINVLQLIGYNIKTGEIFHATFPDKGPDLALRSARQLTGSSHVRFDVTMMRCLYYHF